MSPIRPIQALSAAPGAVKMGSAAPILTTAAGHSAELVANAAKYTIGGGYWSRMASILTTTIPSAFGGCVAGFGSALSAALLGATETLAGGIGTVVGTATTLGLYPVSFKHIGQRFLSVVPKKGI